MKDWRHATKNEVENMTFEEACELIEKQIKLGRGEGDFRPRAHMTKALEMVLERAKKTEE